MLSGSPEGVEPPEDPFVEPKADHSRTKRNLLLAVAAVLGVSLSFGVYTWVHLPDVRYLAAENPGETALMRQRALEAEEAGAMANRTQIWVPISELSPRLLQAVLMAEDAGFYGHNGFDLHEIKESIKRNWEEGRKLRGASTITQQLAKNLYLSTERSYFRKIKEAIITRRLERALTKKRIFEIYLNVIEWGDGVYGAEAAARHVYGKSAAQLSALEAATLAAMIPNPRALDPRTNPNAVKRRRGRILRWMQRAGHITEADLAEPQN